jgi:hypothetical protein
MKNPKQVGKAFNLADTISTANPKYPTKQVQAFVEAVTGVRLDGRSINGKARSVIYQAGKLAA